MQPIPNATFELELQEHVTAGLSVTLANDGTMSSTKEYIAIGTSKIYGEEVTPRGRIILMDVADVVPEPGKPLTRFKLKIMCDEDQRGSVTALESMNGFLLSGLANKGQKMYVWNFNEQEKLVGIAFCDTQTYVHQIVVIKNYALVLDLYQGVEMLHFKKMWTKVCTQLCGSFVFVFCAICLFVNLPQIHCSVSLSFLLTCTSFFLCRRTVSVRCLDS